MSHLMQTQFLEFITYTEYSEMEGIHKGPQVQHYSGLKWTLKACTWIEPVTLVLLTHHALTNWANFD